MENYVDNFKDEDECEDNDVGKPLVSEEDAPIGCHAERQPTELSKDEEDCFEIFFNQDLYQPPNVILELEQRKSAEAAAQAQSSSQKK